MKIYRIYFIVVVFVIAGCKSSTGPQTAKTFGTSIFISAFDPPSLAGGGRWFANVDTGVWYDISTNIVIRNTGTSKTRIAYKFEFGLHINEIYQAGNGTLFFDGDSIIRGTLSATLTTNSTSFFFIDTTIGIGRRRIDWTNSYAYRLTLYDLNSNDSLVMSGALIGSESDNRFKGVIYTTESSPDPLGILDGPDDGDWQRNGIPPRGLEPCFPNPANVNTVSRIEIPHKDSVVLTLNKTRNSVVKLLISDIYDPGKYDVDILLDGLKYGEYRLYSSIVDSGKIFTSYGDIMYAH